MTPNFKQPFRSFVKKAHKPLQLAIADAVDDVCERPYDGERKIGDLAGFWVWKFWFNRQQYLIAYRPPREGASGLQIDLVIIDFYKVGPHENFYNELKRYLKELGR